MTNRVFRRELSPQISAENLFDALYQDHSVALWIDLEAGTNNAHSILATGQLTSLNGADAPERWRQLWRDNLLEDCPAGAPLGLMMVLPYDYSRHTLPLDVAGVDTSAWNEPVRVVTVTQSVTVSHQTGQVIAWASGAHENVIDAWASEVQAAISGATAIDDPPATGAQSPARWRDDPGDYRALIDNAREFIRDGEAYQLCLTTRVEVDSAVSDAQLHRLVRQSSPAPYQGLLRLGDISIVSASPETFLRITPGGEVITRPIKGTRPRGDDERHDEQLAQQLRQSEKEQAENLMIVDLMRNDLLKVCDAESIQVTGLFEVESYTSVHQLVSSVRGQLRDGLDAIDAVQACFPAGSMTGAPKQRAVELLAQMEGQPRGIYSGAWGWFLADGSVDLAMTIRTAIIRDGVVSIGVGGGITWSSVAQEEIAEVGHKARRLLEALGVTQIQYS